MNFRSHEGGGSFVAVLEQLSSTFARIRSGEIDRTIEVWMERIDRALGLDRSAIAEFVPEKLGFQVTHQWTREGFPPLPLFFASGLLPWTESQLRMGQPVVVTSFRSPPASAVLDRAFMRSPVGPKATVVMPLIIGGQVVGSISFADCHRARTWSSSLVRRLRIVADIFGNALARKRAAIESRRLRDQAEKTTNLTLLGQMAAAMAHELNHPLGAILTNAQTARRILERDRPKLADISEIIDDIISCERRASGYMQHVRNLLRKKQPPTELLEVGQLLDGATSLVRRDMLTSGISVEIDIESSLPSVTADRTGIEQVMINLLRNAADAISAGDQHARCVKVRAFRQNPGWITIAVSDTGSGIDEKNLDRLFEPLFSTKEKGTGMGLSIVRSIIESHGGNIKAHSNQGRGATFEFTLPVSQN